MTTAQKYEPHSLRTGTHVMCAKCWLELREEGITSASLVMIKAELIDNCCWCGQIDERGGVRWDNSGFGPKWFAKCNNKGGAHPWFTG